MLLVDCLLLLVWTAVVFIQCIAMVEALRGCAFRSATPKERARALLLAHLSEEQRLSLESRSYFWVAGTPRWKGFFPPKATGNKYVMTAAGEIFLPPDTGFCVRGIDPIEEVSVPNDDTLLACLLLIRYDEGAFLKAANKFRCTRQFPA